MVIIKYNMILTTKIKEVRHHVLQSEYKIFVHGDATPANDIPA